VQQQIKSNNFFILVLFETKLTNQAVAAKTRQIARSNVS